MTCATGAATASPGSTEINSRVTSGASQLEATCWPTG